MTVAVNTSITLGSGLDRRLHVPAPRTPRQLNPLSKSPTLLRPRVIPTLQAQTPLFVDAWYPGQDIIGLLLTRTVTHAPVHAGSLSPISTAAADRHAFLAVSPENGRIPIASRSSRASGTAPQSKELSGSVLPYSLKTTEGSKPIQVAMGGRSLMTSSPPGRSVSEDSLHRLRQGEGKEYKRYTESTDHSV